MAINQDIVDSYVEYRTWLLRYENAVVRDVLEVLARGEEQAIGAIVAAYDDAAELGEVFTGRGLVTKRRVIERVRAAVLDVFPAAEQSLRQALEIVAEDTQAQFVATLKQELPPFAVNELQLSRVPERQIANYLDAVFGDNQEGTSVGQALTALKDRVATQAQTVVAEGLRDGTGTRALIGRVRSVVGVGRGKDRNTTLAREIATYVRTAVQQTANDVAEQSYRENDDIVRGRQYVATLDVATCPVCGPLDGTVYTWRDKVVPLPPRHPNCRCFMAPVLKDWRAMGLPDSMPKAAKRALDGKPAERTLWSDWVTRNPQRLERVLGPGKADLIQSGRVSLDDLYREGSREVRPLHGGTPNNPAPGSLMAMARSRRAA